MNSKQDSDAELRRVLVGRTVVSVEVDHYPEDESWPQGDGTTSLTLDNGDRVIFSAWGYDAWGVDVEIEAGAQT
jgi:hypothetical protein